MPAAGRAPGAPAFARRGVMLDISRTRVPTMRELYRTIDMLAGLRANHLELYCEHAFAYRGHEEVSRGASPTTADELTRLAAHAGGRGVTVGANQNCLGHMTRWLALPRYAPLAETHGAWDFLGTERSGPWSLCPGDGRAIELVRDMVAQQCACVHGGGGERPIINIGCDEAFDIGAGGSAEAVASRGIAAVYGEHVGAVCRIAAGLGARASFWADMAIRHPGALGHIPADAVALVWGYEPETDFAAGCRACRGGGREVWVCPGTSSWRSITGRTAERRANLAAAVRGGLAAGARGLMVCDWGDLGHLQQRPIAERAIEEAMAAAWAGTAEGAASATPGGRWLDALGDADLALRRAMREGDGDTPPLVNAGALFTALWPARPGYAFPADRALWDAARARLEALGADIPGPPLGRDECAHTVRLALLAAEVGAWLHADAPEPGRWRERLGAAEADHRRLWLVRSRPGGLEESCARFTDLRARLEAESRRRAGPATAAPPDRGHLATERRNGRSARLHEMSAAACVGLILDEDRAVLGAMDGARGSIAALVEAAEPGFVAGGRLVYIGAGTSGRLGVLDASEAPPTFQTAPGRVVGIIAGGDRALRASSEGLEDDPAGAAAELDGLVLCARDTVIGVAAGGTTPFVLGALGHAARAGALTGLIVCTPIERPPFADHLIVLDTGPEVVTGSTRMKAGTATKMALNAISTTLMVREGRVYQNLMVDLRATNDKLRDRAARIIATLTGLGRPESLGLLDAAGGVVKAAVVMHMLGLDRAAAERRLAETGCRLDRALGE